MTSDYPIDILMMNVVLNNINFFLLQHSIKTNDNQLITMDEITSYFKNRQTPNFLGKLFSIIFVYFVFFTDDVNYTFFLVIWVSEFVSIDVSERANE